MMMDRKKPGLGVVLAGLFLLTLTATSSLAQGAPGDGARLGFLRPEHAVEVAAAVADGTTPPEVPASETSSQPVDTALSDERELSRWAFVRRAVVARVEPSNKARRVKRLTTRTPDRTAELVLALRERVFPDGAAWVEVRLPMRPNNTTGWVPRSALAGYRVVRTRLLISLSRHRATLFRRGRRVWSAPVGVGQRRWPTPRGDFYVRDRLIPTRPNTAYGVFAFGLSAYSNRLTDWPGGGMIGVHGTNQPELIPGRVSHGCVRVRNAKIRRLRKLMGVGTPVQIR